MRVILQRVNNASVTVEGQTVGEIGKGYLLLLGVSNSDTKEIAEKMVNKIRNLRIFADENDKTNLTIADVDGEVLVVSQFTLYADCKKGNRPSFTNAGGAEMANAMYEYFVSLCKPLFKSVECGVFGEHMKVNLENNGPFTLVLDSDNLF